jgi:hypothetical protein
MSLTDGKIYIGQSYTVSLDAVIDISTAQSVSVAYQDPDGVTGTVSGTRSGTKVEADISTAMNSKSGIWRFQSVANFASGKILLGKTVTIDVTPLWE